MTRRRGSVLILAVALLVLLAVIGTAYISTVRNDVRSAASGASATSQQELVDAAAAAVENALVQDLYAGGNLRPGAPDQFGYDALNGGGDGETFQPYDAPFRPRYSGFALDQLDRLAFDPAGNGVYRPAELDLRLDAFTPRVGEGLIASRVPVRLSPTVPNLGNEPIDEGFELLSVDSPSGINLVQRNLPVWLSITRPLLGGSFESPLRPAGADAAGGSAYPAGLPLGWTQADATVLQEILPDGSGGINLAGQRLGRLTPTFTQGTDQPYPAFLISPERDDSDAWRFVAGDTDGDGVADAGLERLPFRTAGGTINGVQASDITWYVATRILDNNSAVNVNTAYMRGLDLGYAGSNTDYDVQLVASDGMLPSSVGLVQMLRTFDGVGGDVVPPDDADAQPGDGWYDPNDIEAGDEPFPESERQFLTGRWFGGLVYNEDDTVVRRWIAVPITAGTLGNQPYDDDELLGFASNNDESLMVSPLAHMPRLTPGGDPANQDEDVREFSRQARPQVDGGTYDDGDAAFTFASLGDAAAAQLATRVGNPGLSWDVNPDVAPEPFLFFNGGEVLAPERPYAFFEGYGLEDAAALADGFTLARGGSSNLEQDLRPSLVESTLTAGATPGVNNVYEFFRISPDNGNALPAQSAAATNVYDWFVLNFFYDFENASDAQPRDGGPNHFLDFRPRRALLTAHNPTSNAVPSRLRARGDFVQGDGSFAGSTSYYFGDVVSGPNGRKYVAIRDIPAHNYAHPLSAPGDWQILAWDDVPTKTDLNTAPVNELWLAFWQAITERDPRAGGTGPAAGRPDERVAFQLDELAVREGELFSSRSVNTGTVTLAPATDNGTYFVDEYYRLYQRDVAGDDYNDTVAALGVSLADVDPYIGQNFDYDPPAPVAPLVGTGQMELDDADTVAGDVLGTDTAHGRLGVAAGIDAPDYDTSYHPLRMFRSVIRDPRRGDNFDGGADDNERETLKLGPAAMARVRAAIMAANAADLRDADILPTRIDVEVLMDVREPDTATATPGYADNDFDGDGNTDDNGDGNEDIPVTVRVFGNEPQPFISEFYARVDDDTADTFESPAGTGRVSLGTNAVPYVAIELYNPTDQPINLSQAGYRLATIYRREADADGSYYDPAGDSDPTRIGSAGPYPIETIPNEEDLYRLRYGTREPVGPAGPDAVRSIMVEFDDPTHFDVVQPFFIDGTPTDNDVFVGNLDGDAIIPAGGRLLLENHKTDPASPSLFETDALSPPDEDAGDRIGATYTAAGNAARFRPLSAGFATPEGPPNRESTAVPTSPRFNFDGTDVRDRDIAPGPGGTDNIVIMDPNTLPAPTQQVADQRVFVPNLHLILNREVVLLRPDPSLTFLDSTSTVAPVPGTHRTKPGNDADAAEVAAEPEVLAFYQPIDSLDLTGLGLQAAAAVDAAEIAFYRRASEDPTSGATQPLHIYPGRYVGLMNTTQDDDRLRQQGLFYDEYNTADAQYDETDPTGSPGADGTPELDPYTTDSTGGALSPDTLPDFPLSGSGPSNDRPSLDPSSADPQGIATYDNIFELPLFDGTDPASNVARVFPFGGFRRAGDVANVPFVGSYVIYDRLNLVAGQPRMIEANAVTMDSVFAEDTDPNTDAVLGTPTADELVTAERLGRAVPVAVTDSTGPDTGTFRVNDFAPPTPDPTLDPNLDDLAVASAGGDFGSGFNYGQDVTKDFDADGTDDYAADGSYRYRWALDLPDFFTVRSPTDDHLPHVNPVAYADASGEAPIAVPNEDPLRVPSRVYGRVVAGINTSSFSADAGLAQDSREDDQTLYVGRLIQWVTGSNAGEWSVITRYDGDAQSGGGANNPIDLRAITTADAFTNTPATNDVFVIYGDAEDEVGTHGLININTAPAKVLAMLPMLPPFSGGTAVPTGAALPADETGVADFLSFYSVDNQELWFKPTTSGPADPTRDMLFFDGPDWLTGGSDNPVATLAAANGNGVDDNEDLARAIVYFRDVDDGSGNPGGPFTSLYDLYRVPAVRQAQSLYTGGSDDLAVRFLVAQRISNHATVRSDTYTVYTVLEGWVDAGTPNARRVVQRRRAYFVDRSVVTEDNPRPERLIIGNE